MRALFFLLLLVVGCVPSESRVLSTLPQPTSSYERLDFGAPTARQRDIIADILGDDVAEGIGGPFLPDLLVSKTDLNNDAQTDLVVVQKSFCSNHSCDFIFLLNDSGTWKNIADIASWALPYVVRHSSKEMNDIIIFDHITDDCLACSAPKPVKFVWTQRGDSESAGKFVRSGPVLGEEEKKYSATPMWEYSESQQDQ